MKTEVLTENCIENNVEYIQLNEIRDVNSVNMMMILRFY